MQVIDEWVESKTLDEVLAAMKESRVPSGELSPLPRLEKVLAAEHGMKIC